MNLEGVNWRGVVSRYQKADVRRAVVQIVNTLGPLLLSFYLMYRSMGWSYWATLLLAIPTAGLLVRTFIIMHDCGHGSFLPSQRYNNFVGYITGVLTMTPYTEWRHEHAIHHASAGDLDRRGHGDIWTLTVEEYKALGRWKRLKYRFYRNPLVMFGLGPIYLMVGQRFPGRNASSGSPKTSSIWATNLGIAVVVTALVLAIGLQAVLWVYLPVGYLAAGAGVYLFYVQHQFDDAYWQHHSKWDYATAAIEGSSYLKMPKILQWFTGNIGLHHVHHLAPRVPNYYLQRAHDENAIFAAAPVITLPQTVRLLRLALWDEQQHKLVPFSSLAVAERS